MNPGGEGLSIWTIYASPTDYPGLYVVRCWRILGGGRGLEKDAAPLYVGGSLEEARAALPRERGLYCMGRRALDEPQIVESWI